jgi:hypothetical protein
VLSLSTSASALKTNMAEDDSADFCERKNKGGVLNPFPEKLYVKEQKETFKAF